MADEGKELYKNGVTISTSGEKKRKAANTLALSAAVTSGLYFGGVKNYLNGTRKMLLGKKIGDVAAATALITAGASWASYCMNDYEDQYVSKRLRAYYAH